jgi:hypothetical protein
MHPVELLVRDLSPVVRTEAWNGEHPKAED